MFKLPEDVLGELYKHLDGSGYWNLLLLCRTGYEYYRRYLGEATERFKEEVDINVGSIDLEWIQLPLRISDSVTFNGRRHGTTVGILESPQHKYVITCDFDKDKAVGTLEVVYETAPTDEYKLIWEYPITNGELPRRGVRCYTILEEGGIQTKDKRYPGNKTLNQYILQYVVSREPSLLIDM